MLRSRVILHQTPDFNRVVIQFSEDEDHLIAPDDTYKTVCELEVDEVYELKEGFAFERKRVSI